jgi:hypothetical protein
LRAKMLGPKKDDVRLLVLEPAKKARPVVKDVVVPLEIE